MPFINREKELAFLEEQYKEKRSNFIVIYGRRRTGKTTIIREFIKDKPSLYFLADTQTDTEQLADFQVTSGASLNDPALAGRPFRRWGDVFEYLTKQLRSSREKVVLVIDEYSYLHESNKAISSILQKQWDSVWQDMGTICLIVCGSLVGMMEQIVLRYSAPLYGRSTGILKLKPFQFHEFRSFFPLRGVEEQVQLYAVLGGTPRYSLEFNSAHDIWTNIKETFCATESILYRDPVFVLSQEVAKTGTYFSLLKTIAFGEHTIGKIARALEVKATALNPYLEKLIALDLIAKRVPVTEKPHKSKRGLYVLKDHFFRFWFRYIFANRSFIEEGNPDLVIQQIQKEFPSFVSFAFEDIVREEYPFLTIGGLPRVQQIGGWWSKREEVDIVGIHADTDEILFGEVKWQSKPVSRDVLNELNRKSAFVEWGSKKRKEYFFIISKSGFTDEFFNEVKGNERIFLLTPSDLARA